MRVLMLGWEFPPHSSGGLGTACHGLVKGLTNQGTDVLLLLPSYEGTPAIPRLHIRTTEGHGNVDIKAIPSLLTPYVTSAEYLARYHRNPRTKGIYGSNLYEEVQRYAAIAADIAKEERFDVIHAHDWLTFLAGMRIKKITGKPLIVHVHATEYDRSGDNPNPYVFEVEREGMRAADAIIAVSNYTKQKIVTKYGIAPEKVRVVYNAVEHRTLAHDPVSVLKDHHKIVLFLGRMTMQKGPDYFINAARMVADNDKDARFILAGTGDMEPHIIEKAVELGLADKCLFTGFLSGPDIDRAFRLADVYVMPSVSEPFGITALEAMRNGTPVILSKQSGVSEVISHCLRADFWDVHELAHKILSVLRYAPLGETLAEEGDKEVKRFSWDGSARECMLVYDNLAGST